MIAYVTSQPQLTKQGIKSERILQCLQKTGMVIEVGRLSSNPSLIRDKIISAINDEITSIVIVGNHQVIPFFPLDNPTLDSDKQVWSDNPYGCREDDFLLPDYPISRVPSDPDNPKFLKIYLETDNSTVSIIEPAYGISTKSWEHASRDVFSIIPDKHKIFLVSPPLDRSALPINLVKSSNCFRYFNVHGSKFTSVWYGQQGSNYPAVIAGEDLIDLKGIVVISEACYGGWLAKRGKKTSMAMKFLLSGAALFLGSTTISYGPSYPPNEEADLICRCFIQQLLKKIPAARALLNAREEFINLTVSRQGYLDGDDRKTLYQFVLYGKPDIIVKEGS
jgi:hypothetical protein